MSRSPRLCSLRLAHLVCLTLGFCVVLPSVQAQRNSSASAGTQQKLAALKQARDSGVLTEAEYEAKVAALTGAGGAPAASGRSAGAAAGSDGHTWKLHRQEQSAPLTDYRSGGTRTFKMVSMLVPEGWEMTPRPSPSFGKIDCNDNSSRFVLSARSSDNSIGILVLPAAASMWSTNQAVLQQKRQFNQQWKMSACQVMQPQPLSAYLQENIPKIMPGTRVLGGIEPIPGLSAQLPQIVSGSNQQMASQGAHMSAEAGRQRISYNANGRQYDAWVVAMKTERTTSAPGGGQIIITDYPLLAIEFAPAGQLDKNDKLLSTVLESVQVDPEWTQQGQGYVAAIYSKINGAQQEVARIHANMAQDNARAAQQQQQIRNGVQQYRSQVMSNVAANRSAALDHSSQQFALYMGDQAIYKDPSTGQRVQMSSGYDHVWASTTGNTNDYIMTDSASYNPNGNAGSAGWTQMQMEH